MHVSGACAQEDSEANACPPLRLHCEIKWLEVKETPPKGQWLQSVDTKSKLAFSSNLHISLHGLCPRKVIEWFSQKLATQIYQFTDHAKGFSCLRWVSSWFHHFLTSWQTVAKWSIVSFEAMTNVVWAAQGEPIGAMSALLFKQVESWTFLENYNELKWIKYREI